MAIERTSQGLREALFTQMERLASGDCTPAEAQAQARLACQIINAVKMEIDYHNKVAPQDAGKPTTTLRLVA